MTRSLILQPLPLIHSSTYTGSVYLRSDINLLQSPASINSSPWIAGGTATPTFVTSTLPNPIDGSANAIQATFVAGTGGAGRGVIQQTFTGAANTQHTMAIWAAGTSSGGSFFLGYYNGSTPITQISPQFTPAANVWQQYAFNFTTGPTDVSSNFVIVNDSSDTNTAFAGKISFYGGVLFPTNSTGACFIGYYDGANPISQISSIILPPNNSWQRYPLTFSVGATDPSPSFVLVNDATDTGTSFAGTLAFFGAKVEPGSTMTAFAGCAPVPRPTASNITLAGSTGIVKSILIPSFNSTETVISVAITIPPTHGTATVSGTTINYTSNTGFTGADSIGYTVTNTGGTSPVGTISLTINVGGGRLYANSTNPGSDMNAWQGENAFVNQPIDMIHGFTNRDQPFSQIDFPWNPTPRSYMMTSQYCSPGSQSLDMNTAANGGYNSFWLSCFQGHSSIANKIAIVRIWQECNQPSFPWSTQTSDRATFIAAWRQQAQQVRIALPNAKIDWNLNEGGSGGAGSVNGFDLYPGDDLVDIISIDSYARFADPMSTGPGFGVTGNGVLAFAQQHGKLFGIGEYAAWQCGSGYITSTAAFLDSMGATAAYHSYYDQGTSNNGGNVLFNGSGDSCGSTLQNEWNNSSFGTQAYGGTWTTVI